MPIDLSKEIRMFVLAAGDDGVLGTMIFFVVLMAIMTIAVGLAIIDFRRHLRENVQAKSFCSKCAYDLRTGHERCPECGTPTPPLTNASSMCSPTTRSWASSATPMRDATSPGNALMSRA